MIKFEDSQINFFKNVNGYYKVGEKFYYKKWNAVKESTLTNKPISWDFHRSSFETAIQKSDISLNLLEHYRIRAQQLRDSYDYLILAYTGGSDSDNILKTFLKNNIHLNEIWADFPQSLVEKGGYKLSNSVDASNMAVEWYTIVIPELKKINSEHPNIKINFSDAWENRSLEDYEDTNSMMNIPGNFLLLKRFRYIQKYAAKLIETGKKVAIILGIDKPIPYIKQDMYGMVFGDKATFFKSDYVENIFVPVEYFYWSPLYPELHVAQSRLLWNYLLQHKDDTLARLSNYNRDSTEILDRNKNFDWVIKHICYPHWDFSRIQVNKSGTYYNTNYSRFLEQFSNEYSYQSWQTATRDVVKLPKYIFNNGDPYSDIKWNYSFFSLGKINW